MKLPLTLMSLTWLLLSCMPDKEASQDREMAYGTFLQSVNIFNQAFQDGDVNALEAMITDNYRHSNGSSPAIGKEAWLNYLRTRSKEIEAGKLEVLAYRMLEEEIQFYGNAAWLTARIDVRQQKGEEIQEQSYRVSNLWVYEAGSWKRAGFHDGKIQ